jgi:putative replication protein repA
MATISAEKMHREEIEEALEPYCYIGQLEEGVEDGYRHWQLLIDGGKSPIRFSTLKNKLPTAHLEPRRGPIQQAIEYVTKETTRVTEEPRLKHGTIKHSDERGRRKDVDIVREAVLEKGLSADEIFLQVPEAARMTLFVEKLVAARERVQNSAPREIEVLWLYGPPGTGKTSLAVDIGGDDFYRVTDYSHPFDSYAGEKTLILDEFDGSMPLSLVLNVLDVWPMSLPARYANKAAAYTHVVMVSNESPWGYYLWEPASRRQALARRIDAIIHIDSYGAHDETRLRDKFFA